MTKTESAGIFGGILVPTIAKGVIIRRPKVVGMAERFELDSRAVRRMQRLRNRYGSGPLMMRLPAGLKKAVVLDPEHVHHVLDNSPEPFATASTEKKAALSHFEPKVSLISHGAERTERRRYNERVLDTHRQMHRLAENLTSVVQEEARVLLDHAERRGELVWDDFFVTWYRVVRRVVFGSGARDDHELTDLIGELRADGNWAFLKPKRHDVRREFFRRMNAHLGRAEPGSLAGVMAETHATPRSAPSHQVPQWLFAFDPAGMATFRALALLATHPEQRAYAREESAERTPSMEPMPYLRGCILDTLRLWPTTPMVLRESTRPTQWENGVMPEGTGILIYAPFFHRDDETLPYAHDFSPELWLREENRNDWPLIPFSSGPGQCPGQNLVLMLTSTMLAEVIGRYDLRLLTHELSDRRPLPGTLDNYSIRFGLERRTARTRSSALRGETAGRAVGRS